MSELKTDKISPFSGTATTVGDSGDTFTVPSGATLTVAGTLTITGTTNFTTVEATGDTSAGDNAAIGYTSAEGIIITGQGSTNDVTIKNDADAAVIQIPTGTTNVTLAGDLTVAGDYTVNGDTTTVNTATLSVEDPLIVLASGNNAADSVDIGMYGLHDTSGSQDLYSGLFRDASDSGKWKLFKDNQAAPTTTVNTSGTGYAVATLVANLEATTATLGGVDIISTTNSKTLTNKTLTTPVITEIDSGSTITLDATTDIVLDAGGADVFLKDDGTLFGTLSQAGGELVIKSSSSGTTALTFAGANATLAGTLGVGAVTSTGIVTGTGFTIGSAVIAEAELEMIDGITAGTAAASKALVLDGNKDIGTIRNLTIDGTLSDGNYTFDTSGNVSGLGTVGCGAVTSSGIVTGTGFTAGSAVLAEAELEFLDGITAGTVAASKCLVVDSNKDLTALNDVRMDSLGIATAASGTSGEIRATNDVTAFYSSDIALKENIVNIPSPMDLLSKINGVFFDWKQSYIDSKGGEDGYFVRKRDVGVIAQEVEKVMPEIVGTRKDGLKGIKYERLTSLLIECVKDLQGQIDILKGK